MISKTTEARLDAINCALPKLVQQESMKLQATSFCRIRKGAQMADAEAVAAGLTNILDSVLRPRVPT